MRPPLGIILALLAAPAAAAPMHVAWTTWLRAAPADAATVLDELQAGQTVDVTACDGVWCQLAPQTRPGGVRTGFVRQTMLVPGRPPTLLPAPGPCIDGTHTTPAGPIALRLCPAAPAP